MHFMLQMGFENDPERIIRPEENYPTNQQQLSYRKKVKLSL